VSVTAPAPAAGAVHAPATDVFAPASTCVMRAAPHAACASAVSGVTDEADADTWKPLKAPPDRTTAYVCPGV
jgi:hypothetical protein